MPSAKIKENLSQGKELGIIKITGLIFRNGEVLDEKISCDGGFVFQTNIIEGDYPLKMLG